MSLCSKLDMVNGNLPEKVKKRIFGLHAGRPHSGEDKFTDGACRDLDVVDFGGEAQIRGENPLY